MTETTKSFTTDFVERLRRLDAADRARLKRNAGNTLAESRGVIALFFRLLPFGVPERNQRWYFLVATLFPLADPAAEKHSNLGETLAVARARKQRNEAGFDRRFEVLLDADADQLGFRLRQIIQLLHAAKVVVDWEQLLDDLHFWEHPDRFVQMRWARAYYRSERAETAQPTA